MSRTVKSRKQERRNLFISPNAFGRYKHWCKYCGHSWYSFIRQPQYGEPVACCTNCQINYMLVVAEYS